MSKHHTEKITCPQCSKESDFIVWDSINTVLDPDMKEKVRSGEAFHWKCPFCQNEAAVEYACLYHQMDDHIMIYYVPGDASDAIEFMQSDDAFILSTMKEYTKRVVKTRNQFREKLLILDASLDDRVIELMKPFMISMLHDNEPDLHVQEIRFAVQQDGTYCFAVHTEQNGWGHTEFHQGLYDHIAQSFHEKLKAHEDIVVDFDWAMSVIRDDTANTD